MGTFRNKYAAILIAVAIFNFILIQVVLKATVHYVDDPKYIQSVRVLEKFVLAKASIEELKVVVGGMILVLANIKLETSEEEYLRGAVYGAVLKLSGGLPPMGLVDHIGFKKGSLEESMIINMMNQKFTPLAIDANKLMEILKKHPTTMKISPLEDRMIASKSLYYWLNIVVVLLPFLIGLLFVIVRLIDKRGQDAGMA